MRLVEEFEFGCTRDLRLLTVHLRECSEAEFEMGAEHGLRFTRGRMAKVRKKNKV